MIRLFEIRIWILIIKINKSIMGSGLSVENETFMYEFENFFHYKYDIEDMKIYKHTKK